MADDKGPGANPTTDLLLFMAFLLLLVVVWLVRGGSQHPDVRGIFLEPPPPISTGGSYGPAPGIVATTTNFHY